VHAWHTPQTEISRAGQAFTPPGRADLVVVGRHAKHPGLPGAGSVRHAVLSHAHGPIGVVPSEI
jgi:nucleotide-binding universal stress UspA family protein